ncbi:MAG: metallophosphoesterase [Planctomycetaceae bacterium]|jgi:predicted phosphodiesterase|nr:metallophosphoesterase [Planctomycetaceae bacterium]
MNDKSKTNSQESWFYFIGVFLAVLNVLIAVSAAIVNSSFRIGYVFIDRELFQGFSEILFCFMLGNAVYSICAAMAAIAKKRIHVSIIIISSLSFILSLFFWAVNYMIAVQAYVETAYIILSNRLLFFAVLFGVPFLLLYFPNLKISTRTRNIVAIILTVVFVAVFGVVTIFNVPPFTFQFAVQPVVFDIGTGKYSVVFATNADAQAFVTYTYRGQLKTVYANEAGFKAIGKIHSVKIPRAELDGNQYTAHATRVRERLAYGGKLGKTISTKTYTLKNTTNVTEPRILVASDWHGRLSLLELAAGYLRQKADADVVIFNGDYADFYVNEQQIIKYFLGGAFILTGGEIPGIFVRGNHEVRSNEKIEDLGRKIGLTNMYYQVRRGNNLFTIFDTAESEDSDQWEHDGFYDMLPYFAEQVEWFEGLPAQDNSVNNIILMHDPNFTSEHDKPHSDLRQRFRNKANVFRVDFSVSGHSHAWRISEPNPSNFNFYRIEDGGKSGGQFSKTLADIKLLGNIKIPVVRTILRNFVLQSEVESYKLSLISVGKSHIVFEGVTDSGNYSSQVIKLVL